MADELLSIQPAHPGEREAVIAIAAETGVFSEEEIVTVAELFDGYLLDPEASGYYFLTAHDSGGVLGFACWGPGELSRGAAGPDWIATSAQGEGRGVAPGLFPAGADGGRGAGPR